MTIQELIISLLSLIFLTLIFIIYLKRKNILSFLFPHNWIEVMMIESDNHISQWKQKKNNDLRFTFNKGYYYMFHSGIGEENLNKVSTSIYRQGRLPLFAYIEGNENPIDLRNLKITGNPQLNKQIQKIDIAELFIDDSDFLANFLKKYGMIIVIILVIIVVVILLSQGKTEEVTQTTMQQVKV